MISGSLAALVISILFAGTGERQQEGALSFRDPMRVLSETERLTLEHAVDVLRDQGASPNARLMAAWNLSREVQHGDALDALADSIGGAYQLNEVCIEGIALIRTARAIDVLIALLDSPNPATRYYAHTMLLLSTDDLPPFSPVGDAAEQTLARQRQLDAIEEWWGTERNRFRSTIESKYRDLLEVVLDSEVAVFERLEAMDGLSKLTLNSLVEPLSSLLDADPRLAISALHILARIPNPRSVDLILSAAEEGSVPEVRVEAGFGLWALAPDSVAQRFSEARLVADAVPEFRNWWTSNRDVTALDWLGGREAWSE